MIIKLEDGMPFVCGGKAENGVLIHGIAK